MKQRLITAGVALVILFAVLAAFGTVVLNIAISVIAIIAIFEVLSAEGLKKYSIIMVASCAYGGIIPLIPFRLMGVLFPILAFFYTAVLFLCLLKLHEQVRATSIGFAGFITTAISLSLATACYMRELHGNEVALLLVLVALSGAWISDTGAYFVGRSMGKTKLAPKISPNKTLEGAVGGVIICIVVTLLFGVIYRLGADMLFGVSVSVNWVALVLIMPLVSVAGILGDLSASVIKRQTGVKDFGNIMPGHGGVMDRFDSVFFTAPTIFMISQYISLVTLG